MIRSVQKILYKDFLRKASNPQLTQQKLLGKILRDARDTPFGIKCGLKHVRSYSDYRDQVGINGYEDLREHLMAQRPLMFSMTSGTTAEPKLIPIFKQTVRDFKFQQAIFSYAKESSISGVHAGKILGIVSPAVESYLDNGIAVGSMSGLVNESLPKSLRRRLVLSPQVLAIKNSEEKYKKISELALAEENISMIATANPSTLLRIKEHLLMLKPELSNKSNLFSYLWPNLKVVCTWMGGNCSLVVPKVKNLFDSSVSLVELGYLSTEFRGTITIDPGSSFGVPTIGHNFFEFQDLERPDDIKLVHEIEEGRQYKVIITTKNGLFRYDINDILEVGPSFKGTPTLRFVQKGKGVTSITGEKLYEQQVILAMKRYQALTASNIQFFALAICKDYSGYELIVECCNKDFDISLFEQVLSEINLEFKAKLESKRLKDTTLVVVPVDTFNNWKHQLTEEGKQREAQFKFQYLLKENPFASLGYEA